MAKPRKETTVRQNSNKCIKRKIKAYLELKKKIPPGADLEGGWGTKSFGVSQVGSFLGDSGIQVKFLSLGSGELELIPART